MISALETDHEKIETANTKCNATHMKYLLNILLVSIIAISCNGPTIEQPHMDKTISNSVVNELGKWESYKKDLYVLADTNTVLAIATLDSCLDSIKKQTKPISYLSEAERDLHYLKGELYFKLSDYKSALHEFSFSDQSAFIMARVATYIKLKQFEKALSNLNYKISIFYDSNYELGKYYEVIGNIDSAKAAYQRLYDEDLRSSKDTTMHAVMFCKDCLERIDELNKKNPKLIKEFELVSGRPK